MGLRRRLLLLCCLLLSGCGGPGEDRAPAEEGEGGRSPRRDLSLLLISIDTCRPDHLGCYGHDSIQTPVIDALAAGGIRFHRAAASAPITLPSHATLLTGLYPYSHGVRNNGTYLLSDSHTTLAEWMKKQGFETAAFVSAFVMDNRFGLNQGFDVYDDECPARLPGDLSTRLERPANEVADRAVQWLREEKEGPFLLFLHFFDPHLPLTPPEPFRTEYASSLYDGEIAFVDQQIGRVLDELDRLGLSDETLVCLTGDHGEGMGEHGEETHSVFVYESTIRIPWIIRWPDHPDFQSAGFSRGTVVESLVREVDIVPTLLALLRLPPLPGAEGQSLLPLFRNPETSLRLANYAESLYPSESLAWSEVRSVCTDRWKYIDVPRAELYDLLSDPNELRNLVDAEPDTLARLRSLLQVAIQKDSASGEGEKRIDIDEETRAQLSALGYVAAAAPENGRLASEERPDPKDRIGVFQKIMEARALIREGYAEEGLEILRPLRESEPHNLEIGAVMAYALIDQRRWQRASTILQETLEFHPNNLSLLSNLAVALYYMGRAEEAIPILESVLEADSLFELTHYRLGESYREMGMLSEAEAQYRRELELYPSSVSPLIGLASIAVSRGQPDEAEGLLKEAVRRNPGYALSYYHLGSLYNQEGRKEEAVTCFRQAVELDPGMAEAYYNLALLAKEFGQAALSREYLIAGLKSNPSFPKFYYGLGNLLREEGRFWEAIDYYLKTVQLDATDASAYLNLGVSYARTGDLDQAIEAWRAVLRIAPSSPIAREAQENIDAALMQSQIER